MSIKKQVLYFEYLTNLVGYIYKSHKITLMKLNTKSRYAVMALADMARFDGKNPVSLRDISLRQGISILYLEQIFLKLKKKYGIFLIEDAAHSFMGKYKNQYLGTIGDIGAFSFHETKNLVGSQGGAISINNKKFLKRYAKNDLSFNFICIRRIFCQDGW